MKNLENKIREFLPRLKEVDHFFGDETMDIEHPIKLNDVLEWLCTTKNYSCNMQDGNFYIFGHIWNLSSVFLADQSDELKQFLNSL
jgi:hypothetical protein